MAHTAVNDSHQMLVMAGSLMLKYPPDRGSLCCVGGECFNKIVVQYTSSLGYDQWGLEVGGREGAAFFL